MPKDNMTNLQKLITAEKLHGHARITLTDKDGNKEIHEHDNVVTNWLQRVLNADINGAIDFSKVFPIKDWFSGCFLIAEEVEPDVGITMLPSDAHITAHAGAEAYVGEDATKGTPSRESGEVTNGYKFVWDWGTASGNGDISTVCLTHKTLGEYVNTNLMNEGTALHKLGTAYSSNVAGNKDEANTMVGTCELFDFGRNIGYQITIDSNATADAITIIEKRVPMCNVGVLDNFDLPHIDRTRKISVINKIDKTKISLHLDDDFIWIIEVKSATSAFIHKISRADYSITQQLYSWTGVSFDVSNNVVPDLDWSTGKYPIDRFPVIGEYIYFLDSNKTTFYKCNYANTADVSILQTTFETPIYPDGYSVGKGNVVMPNGNFAGYKCYVRGDVVYPFDMSSSVLGVSNAYNGGTVLNNAICLLKQFASTSYGEGSEVGVLAIIGEMVSTVNKLRSRITKTADRTMKLEYTITVAQEGE